MLHVVHRDENIYARKKIVTIICMNYIFMNFVIFIKLNYNFINYFSFSFRG